MKKVLTLITVIVLMLIALVACGTSRADDIPTEIPTEIPTTSLSETSQSPWDGSYNTFNETGKSIFVVDISDNKVIISWLLSKTTKALYWAGSFQMSSDGNYVSIRNVEAMSHLVPYPDQQEAIIFTKVGDTLSFDTTVIAINETYTLDKI